MLAQCALLIRLKCNKFNFGWESSPRPSSWLAGFMDGSLLCGRGGKRRSVKEEGKEQREKGRGKADR